MQRLGEQDDIMPSTILLILTYVKQYYGLQTKTCISEAGINHT